MTRNARARSERGTGCGSAEADLDRLYGPIMTLLTPLCSPTEPHRHRGVLCKQPGKTPICKGWKRMALARYAEGSDPAEHGRRMAAHLDGGGNAGLVVPPRCVVLDADSADAVRWCEKGLPDAPRQATAKGSHFWVRAPAAPLPAWVAVEVERGVRLDLRVGGMSQVVVDPSVHSTGTRYRWERPLPAFLEELPMCPSVVVKAIGHTSHRARSSRRREWASVAEGVEEGARNDTLARLVGKMLRDGVGARWVRLAAHGFASLCRPPMDPGEVDGTFRSILAREERRRASESDPEQIVRRIIERERGSG